MEFSHKPVLLNEAMELLMPERGGIFVDGTLGGGGHSEAILQRLKNGRLIGIDRDADAIDAASERLKGFKAFKAVRSRFQEIAAVLDSLGIEKIDGALLDLGVSSFQLDNAARGFSYNEEAPLDMRMDERDAKSAYDVVNGYSEAELYRVIRDFGEERWALRIAKFIVAARNIEPIKTTYDLNAIIKAAIPASARRDGPHPSKRTFQALRIEVNDELASLEGALRDFVARLNPGGRIAVITFHSLEDRIVKQTFKAMESPCVCPPKSPACVCGLTPVVKVITRKAVAPSGEELQDNPRARSAHIRAAQKL